MAKKKKASGPGKTNPMGAIETQTPAFAEVVTMIREARQKAFQAFNTTLIDLYWQIGGYLSNKVKEAGWGRAIVRNLADYIQEIEPDSKGFSAQNLWRMKQFYETYRERKKLSPLVRELPWSHNLFILGKTKSDEEKEFYLSRSLSPALVSEYQTRLPDKQMLQQKLHEFYELQQKPEPAQDLQQD